MLASRAIDSNLKQVCKQTAIIFDMCECDGREAGDDQLTDAALITVCISREQLSGQSTTQHYNDNQVLHHR